MCASHERSVQLACGIRHLGAHVGTVEDGDVEALGGDVQRKILTHNAELRDAGMTVKYWPFGMRREEKNRQEYVRHRGRFRQCPRTQTVLSDQRWWPRRVDALTGGKQKRARTSAN